MKVQNGSVASVAAHAHDGVDNRYLFRLKPDGDDDVTFELVANAACDSGGICTEGGTPLTEVPGARTLPGPEDTTVDGVLSASFPPSGYASTSHKGASDRPQVLVEFSEEVASFDKNTPSVSVQNGSIASVASHSEDGIDNGYLFRLEPDGNDDVTFRPLADKTCDSGASAPRTVRRPRRRATDQPQHGARVRARLPGAPRQRRRLRAATRHRPRPTDGSGGRSNADADGGRDAGGRAHDGSGSTAPAHERDERARRAEHAADPADAADGRESPRWNGHEHGAALRQPAPTLGVRAQPQDAERRDTLVLEPKRRIALRRNRRHAEPERRRPDDHVRNRLLEGPRRRRSGSARECRRPGAARR